MATQVACSRCGKGFADSYPSCPWCGLPRVSRSAAPARPTAPAASAPSNPAAPAPAPPAPAASPASQPVISISITSRDISGAAMRGICWAARHPRASAGGVAALILGWWILLYIPASPSWAMWDFYDAVKDHNGQAAAAYIDFQSVTRNMMDKGFKTAAAKPPAPGQNPGERIMKEAVARGIGSLLTGPLAETIKADFERKVAQGDPRIQITRLQLLGAIYSLDRNGDSAETSGTDDKGQKYTVIFSSKPDGHWRVVEVDGDAIQKGIEEGIRKGQQMPPGPGAGSDL